jgi:uncharacterized lipoprotein YbaY
MNSEKEKKARLLVEGKIQISSGVGQFKKGIAHISLVDATYQDASSILIAETAILHVDHQEGETVLPFQLEIAEPDRIKPNNDYSIQIWIDRNGNGKPESGDLFSKENHPVLTHGFGNYAVIKFAED